MFTYNKKMVSLEAFRRGSPPPGHLRRVVIPGCKGGRPFVLRLVHARVDDLDRRATCADGIWTVETPGVPPRTVRLFGGSESVLNLLSKYSFIDRDSCAFTIDTRESTVANLQANAHKTNTSVDIREVAASLARREPTFEYAQGALPRDAIECPRTVLDTGIPQTSAQSGICWWGSLWFATAFPSETRRILMDHMVSKRDTTCAMLASRLPSILRDPPAAEQLRRHLYDRWRIGDDPDQDPRLDGQNGYSQFSLLCSAIGFPLVTLVAPWMEEMRVELRDGAQRAVPPPPRPASSQPCLLGVRNHRSQWRPPARLRFGGREFRLQSAFIGSEWCGHQVSLARACGDRWALYDSDGTRLRIGPLSWEAADDEWWDTLSYAIPFANKTQHSKFCDVNPRNRHPLRVVHDLLRAEGLRRFASESALSDKRHMQVNVDWIYSSV